MSAGLRDQRAWVMHPSAAGGDGWGGIDFARVPNPHSADGAWWCRKEPLSARDAPVAEQLDERIDVAFAFSDEVEGLRHDGAIEHDGQLYRIASIRESRMMREIIVLGTLATPVTS